MNVTQDAVWTGDVSILGNVEVGTKLTIGGTCLLSGNFILIPQAIVTIESIDFADPSSKRAVSKSTPRIVADGCVNIAGTISIPLSDSDLASLEAASSKSVALAEGNSGCTQSTPILTAQTSASQCKKVTATPSSSTSGSRSTVSALFSIDSSGCDSPGPKGRSNTWWIILVSVLGGVALIVLIVVLLVVFNPRIREVFRPFSRRKRETTRRAPLFTVEDSRRPVAVTGDVDHSSEYTGSYEDDEEEDEEYDEDEEYSEDDDDDDEEYTSEEDSEEESSEGEYSEEESDETNGSESSSFEDRSHSDRSDRSDHDYNEESDYSRS